MSKSIDKRAARKIEEGLEEMRNQDKRDQRGERNLKTGALKQRPDEQGGGGGSRGGGGGKKRRGPVKHEDR